MIPLFVLGFRSLLLLLFGVMALISIDKLHDFCQEKYKSARQLFRLLSLVSAGLHMFVVRDVWTWHWIYSVGTALLYVRLADGIHSLEMKDVLGNLVLTVVNHFLWFRHFLNRKEENEIETVTACYVLLVWMLPVMYLAACTTDATHIPTFDGTQSQELIAFRRKERKAEEFNNKLFLPPTNNNERSDSRIKNNNNNFMIIRVHDDHRTRK